MSLIEFNCSIFHLPGTQQCAYGMHTKKVRINKLLVIIFRPCSFKQSYICTLGLRPISHPGICNITISVTTLENSPAKSSIMVLNISKDVEM